MNVTTIANLIAQLLMLWYVIHVLRGWSDRRCLCPAHRDAICGAVAFAAALLLLSGVMAGLSDGRQFIAVRQLAELGSIATAIAGMLAIDTIRGHRK